MGKEKVNKNWTEGKWKETGKGQKWTKDGQSWSAQKLDKGKVNTS